MFFKPRSVLAISAVVLIGVVGVAGCTTTPSNSDSDQVETSEQHLDHYDEEPGYTVTNPDDAYPYAEKFNYLKTADAHTVGSSVMEELFTFTPGEYSKNTAFKRIEGISTSKLNRYLDSKEPADMLGVVSGPMWRSWYDNGGGVDIVVEESNEQHPPDTETSYARKYVINRRLQGENYLISTVVAATFVKEHGKWWADEMIFNGQTSTKDESLLATFEAKKTSHNYDISRTEQAR